MFTRRSIRFCVLISITTVLLNSCSLEKIIKISTPTNIRMSDCWISIHIAAWQDLDGDGIWGKYEQPLEGVKVIPQGPETITSGYPLLTKADGQLEIMLWHPGYCSKETYTIVAFPPGLFIPTTPTSLSFTLQPTESGFTAQFGFRLK